MKLYNVEQWYGKRHIATLFYQLRFSLARFKKRVEETKNYPRGTYFKLKTNTK